MMSKPPRGLKQDWSRQLPAPIKVGRCKLRSLDDIRRHLLSLSEHQRCSQVWQNALWYAMKAAEGGDISRAEAAFRLALRAVLTPNLIGVETSPHSRFLSCAGSFRRLTP